MLITQVEKSEARQFLQPAQYCASSNRGVMPVLPLNTDKLLTYYFHNLLLIYLCHIHSKCMFINNFIIIFRRVFHTFFSFSAKNIYFLVRNMIFQ